MVGLVLFILKAELGNNQETLEKQIRKNLDIWMTAEQQDCVPLTQSTLLPSHEEKKYIYIYSLRLSGVILLLLLTHKTTKQYRK